jgi:hypothetical protein
MEMVTTLEKPVCTDDEMQNLPDCPDEAAPPASKAHGTKPVAVKKE